MFASKKTSACMWLQNGDRVTLMWLKMFPPEHEAHQFITPLAECHKDLGLHGDTEKDTLICFHSKSHLKQCHHIHFPALHRNQFLPETLFL